MFSVGLASHSNVGFLCEILRDGKIFGLAYGRTRDVARKRAALITAMLIVAEEKDALQLGDDT
jgi:hypothetical protein